MKSSKAWGAVVGAAVGSAIIGAVEAFMGSPLDAMTRATIMSAVAGIITWFSPPNSMT